jgi:hypothetical protein
MSYNPGGYIMSIVMSSMKRLVNITNDLGYLLSINQSNNEATYEAIFNSANEIRSFAISIGVIAAEFDEEVDRTTHGWRFTQYDYKWRDYFAQTKGNRIYV